MIRKEITGSRQVFDHGDLAKSEKSGQALVSILVYTDSDSWQRSWLEKQQNRRKFARDFALRKLHGSVRSPVSSKSTIRKLLKKLAERCAAMAVSVERDSEEAFWSRISSASYCVNQLPTTGALLAVRKGKIVLEIPPVQHYKGFRLNSRHCLYPNRSSVRLADAEKPESEEDETRSLLVSTAAAREHSGGLKDDNSSFNNIPRAVLLSSISVIRRELPEESLGWPLIRRKSSPNQIEIKKPEARDMSVVEWVRNLPNRVITVVNPIPLHTNEVSINSKINTNSSIVKDCKTTEESIQSWEEKSTVHDEREDNSKFEYNAEVSVSFITNDMGPYSKPGWPLLRITTSTTSNSLSDFETTKMSMVENTPAQYSTVKLPPSKIAIESTEAENPVKTENLLPTLRKMPNDLELCCKQFSLREVKQATSEFSAENLIGEGGCSKVYKGCLPGGKPVAVKVLKSYKEAWSDFSLEVDIVSSLKHKHITPLIGVCVEDEHLISVYDFFPKGSLEEILHGQSKKSVLPWEVRFKVAKAIAEALSYMHNECSRPVIHRDVKSSNILLSDDFQAQLSDFGLAIWGPTDSTYIIESSVVGTFGYIAPEYFMQGRVSDKIDVYSFGVVLLELLSGRRPISSNAVEGKESLIQWAKGILERRNLQELLDPALNGEFDIPQMQRMVLAASICLNQSDASRPKVSQILELLQGEKKPTEGYDFHAAELKVPLDQENDALSPESVNKLYNYLSIPFTSEDSTSKCSDYMKSRRDGKRRRLMLIDYLQKKHDQSNSQIRSSVLFGGLRIH